MKPNCIQTLSKLLFVLGLSIPAFAGEGRIVGGTFATSHVYPFIVAIEETATNSQFCGGTLIAPDKVLTVAHCIYGSGTTAMQIRIGTNKIDNSTGQVYQVASRARHPKYDPFAYDYDVAVLTLATPVTLSNNANIITLPQACSSLQCITGLNQPGVMLRVAGWGATATDGMHYPSDLKEVDVPVVANGICSKTVQGITPRMFCAGYSEGGKDSCQGDSGGPLFAYLPQAKSGMQAGIVSWGNGCADPDQYGVYTRISDPEIRSFIRAKAGV